MKKVLFLAAASLLLATTAHAQGTTPTNGGPAPGPVTPIVPADVPVDGGVSLLLAGGAAYALRRLRRHAAAPEPLGRP